MAASRPVDAGQFGGVPVEGFLFAADLFGSDDEPVVTFESFTLEHAAALRALLNSNVFEHLHTAARAWNAGAAEPPTFDVVTARRHICDEQRDERRGTVIWTDYLAGEGVEVSVPTARSENPFDVPTVYAFGHDGIPLDTFMRVLPHLVALLNDPRVKQVYAEWWPAA